MVVGISYCREEIVVWLFVDVVYQSLRLLWMHVVGGGVGRFSSS